MNRRQLPSNNTSGASEIKIPQTQDGKDRLQQLRHSILTTQQQQQPQQQKHQRCRPDVHRSGGTGDENRFGALAAGGEDRTGAPPSVSRHCPPPPQPWPSQPAPRDLELANSALDALTTCNSSSTTLASLPPLPPQQRPRSRRSSEPGRQGAATTAELMQQQPPRKVVKVINFVAITVGKNDGNDGHHQWVASNSVASKAPDLPHRIIDFPQKRNFSAIDPVDFKKLLSPKMDTEPLAVESVKVEESVFTTQPLQVRHSTLLEKQYEK